MRMKTSKREAAPRREGHGLADALSAAMARRLGETAEQRLRWILDFARKDLSVLRPEEITALGADLRIIALWSLPRVSRLVGVRETIDAPRLAKYQREIAAGLLAILGPQREWTLPEWAVPARLVVHRETGSSPKRHSFRVRIEADERAAVLGAVAELLQVAGERLRTCLECGAPFIATKRQEYCLTTCSQKTRNRRKARASNVPAQLPRRRPGSTR